MVEKNVVRSVERHSDIRLIFSDISTGENPPGF